MGKQPGQGYESIVELELVLEQVERRGVPISRLRDAVASAEAEEIPPEQWGPYIARSLFGAHVADRILRGSVKTPRY
jgi:hypothetical protein